MQHNDNYFSGLLEFIRIEKGWLNKSEEWRFIHSKIRNNITLSWQRF